MPRTNPTRIPKEAKKVFEGVLFDVYQWKQELFDGKFGDYEMLAARDNTQIILLNEKDEILIQYEEQPHRGKFISLPGGQIDDNEDPIHATIRECEEETGLIPQNVKLLKVSIPNFRVDLNSYFFLGKGFTQGTKQISSSEKSEIQFINFDEFIELGENQNFRSSYEFKTELIKAKYDKTHRERLYKQIIEQNEISISH